MENNLKTYIFWATLLNLVLLAVFCSWVHAEDVDTRIIAKMESSGNPFARNGSHIGLCQIGREVLTDYNKAHGTIWTQQDMFNGVLNLRVASWMLNVEIVRLLAHYRIKDTLENRLTAWRRGISWVRHGKKVKSYIKRYKELKRGKK